MTRVGTWVRRPSRRPRPSGDRWAGDGECQTASGGAGGRRGAMAAKASAAATHPSAATRPLAKPNHLLERVPFYGALAYEFRSRPSEPEHHGAESPPLSRLVEPQLGPYRLSREMAPECGLLWTSRQASNASCELSIRATSLDCIAWMKKRQTGRSSPKRQRSESGRQAFNVAEATKAQRRRPVNRRVDRPNRKKVSVPVVIGMERGPNDLVIYVGRTALCQHE
jgi:hypothetical protein